MPVCLGASLILQHREKLHFKHCNQALINRIIKYVLSRCATITWYNIHVHTWTQLRTHTHTHRHTHTPYLHTHIYTLTHNSLCQEYLSKHFVIMTVSKLLHPTFKKPQKQQKMGWHCLPRVIWHGCQFTVRFIWCMTDQRARRDWKGWISIWLVLKRWCLDRVVYFFMK